jgi:type IV secretory pathway VirB9-like protein
MTTADHIAPRPRATMAQAFAAALALDATARAAGRDDAAAGRPFAPGENELLAYASGYHEGRLFGR